MGVRSSVLHHSERSGRWVLAGQSRYGDGFPADDAGGLCAGVREDGRRRKVRDGQRTIHSSTPSSKGPAERCTRLRGELSRGVSGWRDRVSQDRKSTRLNSSHGYISYAVFCLKKKKNNTTPSLCGLILLGWLLTTTGLTADKLAGSLSRVRVAVLSLLLYCYEVARWTLLTSVV